MPFANWTDIVTAPGINPALIPAFPQIGAGSLRRGLRDLAL